MRGTEVVMTRTRRILGSIGASFLVLPLIGLGGIKATLGGGTPVEPIDAEVVGEPAWANRLQLLVPSISPLLSRLFDGVHVPLLG